MAPLAWVYLRAVREGRAREAVFLAVMPNLPVSAVLAALLVWRLLYLLLPLALSGPIILAFEHRQLARRA